MDAIPDLYHEKAMVLINQRTDEALAQGIEQITSMDWDKQFIQNYAQNFSLELMAKNYINAYEKIINGH